MTDLNQAVLTPEEAALILKCSKKTVIKLAKAGAIDSFRLGDLWRFTRDAIERFIRGDKEPRD